MAEREQPKQPTHRAYSVIRREGQDDFWLNVGLAFPHKDGRGSQEISDVYERAQELILRTKEHRNNQLFRLFLSIRTMPCILIPARNRQSADEPERRPCMGQLFRLQTIF